MWKKDGFSITEHERRAVNGLIWVLMTAYSRDFTDEYGRHFGLMVALDKDEIIAHDFINLRDSTNPTRETMDWFEENIRQGIQ
jgi:hypothetical protein